MKPRLGGRRFALILLPVVVLGAGCSRDTTAEPVEPATAATSSAQVGGDPSSPSSSTASPSTPGTSGKDGTSTRLTSPHPSSRGVPGTVAGPRPGAGATPVFTVTVEPTFYCETTSTLTPTTVVYDDGTVLVADALGAYCDPVPRVRIGAIDLAELNRLATAFFQSPDAAVDLSELPVTDLPITTVIYRPTDGISRSVRVYGLGAEKIVATGGITAAQEQARKKLAGLLDAVKAPAKGGTRWVPDRLVVAGGIPGGVGGRGTGADPVRRWPIPLSPTVRAAVDADRNHRACAVIDDAAQVAAVLKTHGTRPTDARWRVDGHERRLAIGIVLPGQPACSH
ncbi:MAG: hypothetical protein WKF57_03215 [Nakamurella sp.]